MYDIQLAHRQAGGHFFDPDSMRFFSSRIQNNPPHVGPGGVFFVTSEQFISGDRLARGPRRYTVRAWNPDYPTAVESIDFQAHATSRAAHRDATRRAAGTA